ncbi:MAG: segregation and condensation protein A [Gammaproteobacteria bacterium]|nr:segregation and condensation protein A [Gammaproteobacteria bacterium]MDQ7073979.1 segregation and condensation protein A [Gammaproteobacteria bacterium]
MSSSDLSHEHRVLIAMRKTLSAIIKDVTPDPGTRHPLTDSTINDIRHCFALISAREKELAEERGNYQQARPRFVDEPSDTKVVSLSSIRKVKSDNKSTEQ